MLEATAQRILGEHAASPLRTITVIDADPVDQRRASHGTFALAAAITYPAISIRETSLKAVFDEASPLKETRHSARI